MEPGGFSDEECAPSGDLGASSSAAHEPAPEAPVARTVQPVAPEAEAPEVPRGHSETVPDCSPQPTTPELAPWSVDSASSCSGRHVQRFGHLCVDYGEPRKRKRSPSGSTDFGVLK